MTTEQIVEQLQNIVNTLKRTIEASAQLAERVDSLETNTGKTLGLMTSLQGNLQIFLDGFQETSDKQTAAMAEMSAQLAELRARVEALETR